MGNCVYCGCIHTEDNYVDRLVTNEPSVVVALGPIGGTLMTTPVPGEPIGTFANFVTARLATGGGLSSPADLLALQTAGITAVIDCRAEFDDGPLLASSTFAYLWNPTADDGVTKEPDWFARSIAFALPLLANPHTRVLCHCAGGSNRGPSTAYAIMRALGWTPEQARTLVLVARPQAQLRYTADADVAIAALGYD